MRLGVIGVGRMGGDMTRRLLRAGHQCAVYDVRPEAVRALEQAGAMPTVSLDDLVRSLSPPRVLWLMLPAALVDQQVMALRALLEPGDIVVDGGNSHFRDDIRRAAELEAAGIEYLDVGASGGVWGLERGYCLMIGGAEATVRRLEPIFAALAPGRAAAPETPGRTGPVGTAELGYLHCGGPGAGHFVKMVHNGIEYGLMAAYAEGFNLLRHAGVGSAPRGADAETAPLPHPELYRYRLDLRAVAEVWRRGSVISSWLLDLVARALAEDPELAGFEGRVADSGEGRWTLEAAIDVSVPAPVLSTALFDRFRSRGEGDFADRLLSALRYQFGGHHERPGD